MKSVNFKQFKQQGRDLIDRGLDRHVRLAITGLSGAGKTNFTLGLLEQMLQHDSAKLPFWQAQQQGRLYGVQLAAQPDLHIPRFPYEQGIADLTAEPSKWPPSTRQLSEIRAVIRVRPKDGWRARLTNQLDVTCDILDYPGEWLLDLPLLQLDYKAWSESQRELLTQSQRAELAQPWYTALDNLLSGSETTITDSAIADLAVLYTEFLKASKQAHFSLLQPARLLVPGDLTSAPMLDLMPWPYARSPESATERAYYDAEAKRYQRYVEELVKPFFKQHFRRFNRQVVLVDLLGAIRAGQAAVDDLQATLQAILPCFEYGENSLLRRLFGARVDRVLFAVTKADLISATQHAQLLELAQQLLRPWLQKLKFDGLTIGFEALSAIRITEEGQAQDQTPALRGFENGEWVAFRPEPLPVRMDAVGLQGYDWLNLTPNFTRYPQGQALPHLRLDRALEFLLGDKL